MSKEGQEKSRKTQFKKGNIPWATRNMGEERIDSKDGYVYTKISERNKWKLKHRHIYEQVYGEIPKGHNVIFADGDRYNFDLDNLILVSNAELAIINSNGLYKKNKELTKTGVLIAKVMNCSKRRK